MSGSVGKNGRTTSLMDADPTTLIPDGAPSAFHAGSCSALGEARICACGCGGVIEKAASMSMSRFRKVRFIRGHNATKPEDAPRSCACGCGGTLVRNQGVSRPKFRKQRYIKGHEYGDEERMGKIASGLKAAHDRGAFVDGCKKRREKTLADRPKCKCGCGKPVRKSGALYAPGCFDATTPENQAKAREARDWNKLSPEYSERMASKIKTWKETGKLDDIRRKAGNATGMLDHLAAKVWIMRDPYGHPHKFSNLAEWARQNAFRFVDDRPESKTPFWKRIAGGLSELLSKDGKSCSYRGWTAVSKLELDAGGADLLGRDYFMQNAGGMARELAAQKPESTTDLNG